MRTSRRKEAMRMKKKDFTNSLKRKVALALSVGMFSIMPMAQALPTGGNVTNGDAVITVNGSTMGINASALNNIINWQTFSIGNGETVTFDANNYLNLVRGSEVSNILGTMNGGGMVFLINPNGILFGQNATINVAALTASTRPLDAVDTEAFLGLGSFSSYDTDSRKDAIYGLTSQEETTYDLETQTYHMYEITKDGDASKGKYIGASAGYPDEKRIVDFPLRHTKEKVTRHTLKPVLPYSNVNYIESMGGEISIAGLTNVNNASEIRLEAGTIVLRNSDVLNSLTEAVTSSLVLGGNSEQNDINIYNGEVKRSGVIEKYYDYDAYNDKWSFQLPNDDFGPNEYYRYGYNSYETDTNTPSESGDLVPRLKSVKADDISWNTGIDAGLKANLSKVVTVPVHNYTRYEQGATQAHTYYSLPWLQNSANSTGLETGTIDFSARYGENPWAYANGAQSQYEITSYSTRPFLTAENIATLSPAGDYILGGDVDITGKLPPGDSFTGTLNGMGYTIKNLTLDVSDSNAGLFSVIDGGTVKNLNLENVSIVNTASFGNTGALAGQIINDGKAENIHVLSGTITGAYNVGGIAGELLKGHILNSSNAAAISSSINDSRLGGIAGASSRGSSIDFAYNTGSVTGAKSYAGGILGFSEDSTSLSHVYNLGTVKGDYRNTSEGHVYNVGGIYGSTNGNVTATEAYYAEGSVQDAAGNSIAGTNIGNAEERNAVAQRIDAIWNTSLASVGSDSGSSGGSSDSSGSGSSSSSSSSSSGSNSGGSSSGGSVLLGEACICGHFGDQFCFIHDEFLHS